MSFLEFLSGEVAQRGADWVVIDLGGLGMRATVLPGTAANLTPGTKSKLWTYLQIREDRWEIYGFDEDSERSVFAQLLNVNGVGPRMAMAALAALGAGGVGGAVEGEDRAALARVPGIGPKTAARIILDLKGKLDVTAGGTVAGGDIAVEALMGLGLRREDALARLAALEPDAGRPPEETVRLALQAHGRRREG